MKKILFAQLIAMSAICLAALGLPASAQPAVSGGKAGAVVAAAGDDAPPTYVLVLAGLSAVVFVTLRRKR
jgi:hypothetical protein